MVVSTSANRQIKIIGHRGARSTFPENTKQSIEAGITLGLGGVEFDVAITSDRVPVIIHEETLEPDLNQSALKLAGADPARNWVSQSTLAVIRQLDAGSWFDARFQSSRVPELREIFDLQWSQVTAYMELKDPVYWLDPSSDQSRPFAQSISETVKPLAAKFLAAQNPLVMLSFNPFFLEIWRHQMPAVPTLLAVWTNENGNAVNVVNRAKDLGAIGITIADSMAIEDPNWLALCRKLGLDLCVYEVTPDNYKAKATWTPENRLPVWEKLVSLGVDAITTDFPESLKKFMGG